jgi:enterochelin esterase-like enzyme
MDKNGAVWDKLGVILDNVGVILAHVGAVWAHVGIRNVTHKPQKNRVKTKKKQHFPKKSHTISLQITNEELRTAQYTCFFDQV